MAVYWSDTEPANLGEMTALPRSVRWESKTRGIQTSAIVNETNGGKRYGNFLFQRRTFPELIWEFPRDLAPLFEAIIETVGGPVRPLWLTLTGNFADVVKIRLDDDRFEPEAFAGEYDGEVQQWFRWSMRASYEVDPASDVQN